MSSVGWTNASAIAVVSLTLGCVTPHNDGCGDQCGQVEASGPAITLTEHSALIAAIETTVEQGYYDAISDGVCEVRWYSSSYADGYPSVSICPTQTQDSGSPSNGCSRRFECPSSAGGCHKAWINMNAEACRVTIVSVMGESQDVQVTKSQDPIRSKCHVECSDSWSDVVTYPGIPKSVTLRFSQMDQRASPDASLGE
jgi:hypothetical protein